MAECFVAQMHRATAEVEVLHELVTETVVPVVILNSVVNFLT